MLFTKLKNPAVLASIVIAVLVIVGAVYMTTSFLNANKSSNKSSAVPKLVSPKVVQKNLLDANSSAKIEFNSHVTATAAMDEQKVVLANQASKAPKDFTASISTTLTQRLDTIKKDQTLIGSSTGSTEASKSTAQLLKTSLDTVKQSLSSHMTTLQQARDGNQLKAVAAQVDDDFEQYSSINQASKLFVDLHAQQQFVGKLNTLASSLQATISAAKANGATHVNAGAAGFVSLKSLQDDLDQLKQTLAINSTVMDSALSTLQASLPGSDNAKAVGMVSGDTAYAFDLFGGLLGAVTSVFGQTGVVQNAVTNVAAGLSQVARTVTGAFGIDICGIGQNCSGQTNNGWLQICGIASTCSDSTNHGLFVTCGIASSCSGNKNSGVATTCGIGSDCSNSTNKGVVTDCGIASNCSGSTNKGVASSCGIGSNCSNSTTNGAVSDCGIASNCSSSTNNGIATTCGIGSNCANSVNKAGIVTCGIGSNCSGNTNNGVLVVCGVGSNCIGNNNSGFIDICGLASNCSNSTSSSVIKVCGALSNCSSTVVIQNCQRNSDGVPIQELNSDGVPIRE